MNQVTEEFKNKVIQSSVFNGKVWQLKLGDKVIHETPVYVENCAFRAVRLPPKIEVKVKRKEENKEIAWWCEDVKLYVIGTSWHGLLSINHNDGNCIIEVK